MTHKKANDIFVLRAKLAALGVPEDIRNEVIDLTEELLELRIKDAHAAGRSVPPHPAADV